MRRDVVLVHTKYGDCEIDKYYKHRNTTPLIQSAVDKSSYFANKATEIHENKYDYSKVNYINAKTPVIIICKEHGEFIISPNAHISKKQGCPTCSKNKPSKKRLTLDQFINNSNKKHNYFYDYSLSVYTGQSKPITIICPKHGEFIQHPKEHMRGCGCYSCAKEKISNSRSINPTGWEYSRWIESAKFSKKFDSFKVYIIECWDESESFIKIGRTYQKVAKRFRTKNMLPYQYKTLNEIVDEPLNICVLEKNIKDLLDDYKYLPSKSFNGMYECYSKDCLNTLFNIINN